MVKSNGQITTARTNASSDLQKASAALNVSARWLRREIAARKL